MAADLRALIRLHRWRVDEKQRLLSQLRDEEERLRGQKTALEQELLHEQAAARANPGIAVTYGAYARNIIVRREKLDHAIADAAARVAAVTEALADTFQELKRYELAQEERIRRQNEELRKAQNAMLDEVALVGFQRRQKEDSEPAPND